MTYAPAIPLSGVAGLQFLDRTYEAQSSAYAQSGYIQRLTDGFTEKVSSIETAQDLVADRELLQVALGAFGLEDEISKKAFLRKVLEEGSGSDSFAGRLADSRFSDFSQAFGFGDAGGVRTGDPGFAKSITDAFLERSFETRVGDTDDSLRLALNFRREMETIANGASVEAAGWYEVLGQIPLRTVFEGAFQLGSSFSQLSIDRQVEELEERTQGLIGTSSPAGFADPDAREALISRYLALEGTGTSTSATSTALQILSGGSATTLQNLLIARARQ